MPNQSTPTRMFDNAGTTILPIFKDPNMIVLFEKMPRDMEPNTHIPIPTMQYSNSPRRITINDVCDSHIN